MNNPHTKTELLHELDTIVRECANFVRSQPNEHFGVSVQEKWSHGQQLDHLIRAAKPLILAFRLPKIAPRLLYGKPNRPSRTYTEFVAKYHAALAKGGRASSAFIPPVVENGAKSDLLTEYADVHIRFAGALKGWSEAALDGYLLPHPLLGKCTIREMIMFTVCHNHHHFAAIQERSASSIL
jgi:hypothetical protein